MPFSHSATVGYMAGNCDSEYPRKLPMEKMGGSAKVSIEGPSPKVRPWPEAEADDGQLWGNPVGHHSLAAWPAATPFG